MWRCQVIIYVNGKIDEILELRSEGSVESYNELIFCSSTSTFPIIFTSIILQSELFSSTELFWGVGRLSSYFQLRHVGRRSTCWHLCFTLTLWAAQFYYNILPGWTLSLTLGLTYSRKLTGSLWNKQLMLYNLHMINHQSHLDPRTLHSPAIPLSESPVPTQHTSAKGIIQLFVQIRQEHKITRYLDDVNK